MYFLKILMFIITQTICLYNMTRLRISLFKSVIYLVITFLMITLVTFKYEYLALIIFDICSLIFLYLDNKKIVKNIFVVISTNLIYLLSDMLLSMLYMNILDGNFQKLESIYAYVIYSLFVLVTSYFFSSLIGVILNKHIYFFDLKINKKTFSYVLALLLITLLLYYANIVSMRNITTNTLSILIIEIILVISFFLIMGIVYMLLKSIKEYTDKSNEVILRNEELKNLKEYMGKLETVNNEMRAFRHDYINILLTIRGYINDRDLDALDEYFSNNIEKTSQKMQHDNANLGRLNNIEIQSMKGLIAHKVIMAQEKKINTKIEVMEKIHNINMGEVDLSSILGILFDNAIEAALNCKNEKSLEFAVIKREKSVILVFRNTFEGELPSIGLLYKEGFSTKGEDRGLGLFILKDILHKYKNVLRETNVKEPWFEQVIEIME